MSYILQYLPQGTALTHLYYSQDPGAPGQVRLADGTVGWVNWDDYLVSRTDYTQGEDYSTATKEGFVNQKGLLQPHRLPPLDQPEDPAGEYFPGEQKEIGS